MGEIFFADGQSKGFGLPKHNLAPQNHTACHWCIAPFLRVTTVGLFFFFHREIVCFSFPVADA